MANHPKYEVAKQHARGVWYVSQWIYDQKKWAVWLPMGVCVSLHDSKKEAVATCLQEELEHREWIDMCEEEGI